MEFRFNPDSGIVTTIRDRDAYNARKQAKANALLELWERGFDHSDDCCVICGARVDLSDIETFELSEFGMICYFCTCDPNEPTAIVDSDSELVHCGQCEGDWELGELEARGKQFYCPSCETFVGWIEQPCLSSSLKSQNNPKK